MRGKIVKINKRVGVFMQLCIPEGHVEGKIK